MLHIDQLSPPGLCLAPFQRGDNYPDTGGGVEQLWEEASSRNLKEFASALTRSEKKIRSSALLIDPEHYQEIMDVIKNMGNYQFGKERLISAKANLQVVQPLEIAELIKKNATNRARINCLINQILQSMRRQISYTQ